MSRIHSTVIIGQDTDIHESVEIGPYSVIGNGVKIGEGTTIDTSVRIHDGVELGKHNRINHAAALGGSPQNIGFEHSTVSSVKIGDHNMFGEYFTVHRSSEEGGATTIGNHCFLMENAHVAHDCKVGDHVVMVHCAALSGHVVAEDYAFISGLTALHQFVRAGTHSMIAGCAKIVKDIPPYTTADGNPATIIGLNSIGMKRAGFKPDVRNAIKKTYKTLYHSGLNTKQALKELKAEENSIPEVQRIIDFFVQSDRGVTNHR
ncbi:MAG: acyl-ACP--UDP-N-acetylglucosamine O-acyltransferase [Spirochaetota bacterium]